MSNEHTGVKQFLLSHNFGHQVFVAQKTHYWKILKVWDFLGVFLKLYEFKGSLDEVIFQNHSELLRYDWKKVWERIGESKWSQNENSVKIFGSKNIMKFATINFHEFFFTNNQDCSDLGKFYGSRSFSIFYRSGSETNPT